MSLEQLKQNVRGEIPNAENFLQRAIQTVKPVNTFVTNDMGAIGGRILNTATAGGSDFLLNKAEQGLTSAGFPPSGPLVPKAETTLGKVLEPAGSAAGFFAGPGKIASGLSKKIFPEAAKKSFLVRSGQRSVEGGLLGAAIPGDIEQRKALGVTGAMAGPIVGGALEGGGKALRAFQTTSIRKKIKSLGRDAEDISFIGSRNMQDFITKKIEFGRKEFGESFTNITSKMKRSDFVKSLERSIGDLAEETGEEAAEQLTRISGSDASILRRFSTKIAPKLKPDRDTGILDATGKKIIKKNGISDDILSKEFVQEQSRKVYEKLSPRGKAIFQKNHLDNIDKTVPGLKEAKARIAPDFTLAKEGKKISRAALKRIASGKASEFETRALIQIEDKIGTSFVKMAQKIGKNKILAQNKLEKIIMRKGTAGKIIGGVGAAGLGLGILNQLGRVGKSSGE